MTSSQQATDIDYKKMLQILSSNPNKDKNMIVEIKPPKIVIKFNRPKRYNAFSMDMYLTLTQVIKSAQTMENIKFIVLTGQGGNFSSGNDLTNFSNPQITDLGDFPDVLKASSRFLKSLTQTIIKSQKPIIALTEGKTIGFAFTMLALLDKVFSTQNTTFVAPLVSSAQGPQLCASYTFPKIFGYSIAQELIFFGKTVTSEYLQKFNFVQKCKSTKQAEQKIDEYLNKIDELEWNSYINARRLFKQREHNILLETNEKQVNNLIERWLNPNLFTYIGKHMQKMKKSAKL